jgi:hypothetical protein
MNNNEQFLTLLLFAIPSQTERSPLKGDLGVKKMLTPLSTEPRRGELTSTNYRHTLTSKLPNCLIVKLPNRTFAPLRHMPRRTGGGQD